MNNLVCYYETLHAVEEPKEDIPIDFPRSEYFDYTEAVASGIYGKLGKRLVLKIKNKKHLKAVVMKSDTATLFIPKVALEVT